MTSDLETHLEGLSYSLIQAFLIKNALKSVQNVELIFVAIFDLFWFQKLSHWLKRLKNRLQKNQLMSENWEDFAFMKIPGRE